MLELQKRFQDKDHWSKVVPKLQTFWRICVLPEVLVQRYTRRVNLTEDGAPLANAVCYWRQEREDTVKYCNPHCAIQQFHLPCSGINAIPKTCTAPNTGLYHNLSEEALSNSRLAFEVQLWRSTQLTCWLSVQTWTALMGSFSTCHVWAGRECQMTVNFGYVQHVW